MRDGTWTVTACSNRRAANPARHKQKARQESDFTEAGGTSMQEWEGKRSLLTKAKLGFWNMGGKVDREYIGARKETLIHVYVYIHEHVCVYVSTRVRVCVRMCMFVRV